MSINLYNTLTRKKEDFEPLEAGKIGLYTCGPTVYNYAHIGNLRAYVFEDILKRALLAEGYEVRHVMNVTDVGHLVSDADEGEDKMEVASAREGRSVWDIAQFYWDAFRRDIERLNILEPDVWCRATDHIPEQIELVRKLEEKGYTYIAEDGVSFDTSKLEDYGKLARLSVEGQRAGARVALAEGRKNPSDFWLWKFSPKDKQRAMEWDSPWGVGFPGWHIECSAMAIRYLGERLDIHCGGIDHIPVHHTNEIAQAECALGHKWVNWWMHGEFLTFPKEGGDEEADRMSKSSGEFLTLDLLVEKGFDPLAYRYFLLNAHYRQQLAFTWDALAAAANAMKRLKRTVPDLRDDSQGDEEPVDRYLDECRAATRDDLNMPKALAAMWGVMRDTSVSKGQVYATLRAMDPVLGFGFEAMEEDRLEISEDAQAEIQKLVDERAAARKDKDFARADEIREQLKAMGVALEDTPEGTVWRKG